MLVQTSPAPQAQSARRALPPPVLPPGWDPVAYAGRGAFCDIWQVHDPAADRLLALKQLRGEFFEQPAARTLLHNEIRVGRFVNSRYVVRSLGGDARSDPPYVLLEWLTGRTLEDELQSQEPLPIARALWIARQCAQGLGDLERAGYAHGDLKPPNIFLLHDGGVKLIDLGFARPLAENADSSLTGLLAGTPEYLAPESLSQEAFSPLAKDVYSLGVTLFRMLTGRLPFTADCTAGVLRQQRELRPPLLCHWRPEASRPVADLVRRLLAKHPIRRPVHLGRLVQELIDLELAALTEDQH